MKNGSSKSSKTAAVAKATTDVADATLIKHREAPSRGIVVDGSDRDGSHLKALKPVPEEAEKDPVGWAEKHIESLAPAAAKELEWALRFGSDSARREVARDLLAMKGITTKPKEQPQMQQAVVLNLGLPVAPSGAPVLPFSNAVAAPVEPPKPLDAGAEVVTVAPKAGAK